MRSAESTATMPASSGMAMAGRGVPTPGKLGKSRGTRNARPISKRESAITNSNVRLFM